MFKRSSNVEKERFNVDLGVLVRMFYVGNRGYNLGNFVIYFASAAFAGKSAFKIIH